jgi:hypothetical protein
VKYAEAMSIFQQLARQSRGVGNVPPLPQSRGDGGTSVTR